MDFTCILSSLPGGWGDLLWLETLLVTLWLYCLVLQEACWCLLLWPGERSDLNFVAAGDCMSSCLLVPPPWSVGEAIPASVAAGVCSIGIAGCKQGENADYIFVCP